MGSCTGSIFAAQGQHTEETQENMNDPLSLSDEFPFVPVENRIDLRDEFDEVEEVGVGSTCSVWSMRQRGTERPCAVKIMKRRHTSNARGFRREANVLLNIHHNHIVELVGLYMDHKHFYIAQELCTGGTLIDRVKREALSERDAIEISYQILDAVKFLHNHNIVHRDIKPGNIMLRSQTSNEITLIDFGQAREVRESAEFVDWVGTPAYMSPEVTRRRTGAHLKKVDIWAVGVTVFVMVTRHLPFSGTTRGELLRDICQRELTFPETVETSANARQFITWLLRRDVDRRPSAGEAMQHHWLDLEAVSSAMTGEEAMDVASNEGGSGADMNRDGEICAAEVGLVCEDRGDVSVEKKEAETTVNGNGDGFKDSRV